ncbi:MAG: hypothetical protein Q8L48_14600 [Archangium sp.]|nr:hypothetical protein [Archangium sp.]
MFALEKWGCVALFVSSVALAQAPQVMPFPLEVKRTPEGFTKEERETTQREFTRLLRLAGAQIPDFARFDFALRELKRQDCEREDECLVQLAKKAESLYAVYASLDFTLEGAVQVSGRVVRDDGKVVSPTQTVTLEGQPFKQTASKALTQLLSQLELARLPGQRPVEAKAVAVIAPPAVSRVDDPGAGQRTTGRAIFIAGTAAAAVSGAFLAAGQVMGGQLTPDAQLNLPLAQLPTFQSARTFTTAGLIGLAAGSVTAVVGAFAWGLAPGGGVKVSAMAGPQGAAISVQGAF